MGYLDRCDISTLLGKTLISVTNSNDEIVFKTEDGKAYKMYHQQDCCESVVVDDINGDLDDLIGSPITMAEESISNPEMEYDSCTWTFYKLATVKGYVDIKWVGVSNGYYSESVEFEKIKG